MDYFRSFSNENQIRVQLNDKWDLGRPKLSMTKCKCPSKTNRNTSG